MNKAEILRYIDERADLFDACAVENCFTGSAWLRHLVEQVTDSQSRFAAPEYLANGGESTMLLYAPRRGEPFRPLVNYYASLASPICSRSANIEVEARQLIRQLRKEPVVDFSPLSTRTAESLANALRQEQWYSRRYFCFGNWYLPSEGLSFTEYMKARPSQLRNTWERKRKKFQGSARIEIFTSDAQRGIEAFQTVYARSWKNPEPYPDFVPGWARICSRNEWLRLGVAWLDETPIAAQFWFVHHGRAYIYKLAYDENYANWSAGTVLTAALMEHVLDKDRVHEVDYLTGDDPYKKSWMNHRRERVGLVACNLRTFGGTVRALREFGGSATVELRNGFRNPASTPSGRDGAAPSRLPAA